MKANGRPAEVVHDQQTTMTTMRNANEQLTLSTLRAQAETEVATALTDKLRLLVTNLESSEFALHEKNMELEKFYDVVVGRELNLVRLRKRTHISERNWIG